MAVRAIHQKTVRPGAERVDARDKVRGALRYAGDDTRPGMLHAMLVPSRIARGTIESIDVAAARRVRGVVAVYTHADIGSFEGAGFLLAGGFGVQSFYPMRSGRIAYRGQTIALVVAESLEAAREAVSRVEVRYDAKPFAAGIDQADEAPVSQSTALPQPMFADRRVGDAAAALAGAAVTVDQRYDLPSQHQNPMEIISTVAEWQDGVLTVSEPTQHSEGVRHGLAKQLGISPDMVRVKSPSIGGGFGQKNALQPNTVLIALAAKRLGRPVKLAMTRAQLFHNATFRPAARHHVRLGADADGRLVSAIHEIDQQTSRHDLFPSSGTEMTSRLYGVPNYLGVERLVRTDVQTPGYMRAPFEHPAAFAFESAIDELAYRLEQDPVAFRLSNDAIADPLNGQAVFVPARNPMPRPRQRAVWLATPKHGAWLYAHARWPTDWLGRGAWRVQSVDGAGHRYGEPPGQRRRACGRGRPRDGPGPAHCDRRVGCANPGCTDRCHRGVDRRHGCRSTASDCRLLGHGYRGPAGCRSSEPAHDRPTRSCRRTRP